MSNLKEIWNSLGTAWGNLSEEDRAKLEECWEMLFSFSKSISKQVMQLNLNSNIMAAFPFFIEDSKYIKLQSDTETSESILGYSVTSLQKITSKIVYTSQLISDKQSFTFNGHVFSNNTETDSSINLSGIYVVTSSGFLDAAGYWEEDEHASLYDSSKDYKKLLPGELEEYE